MSDVLAVLPEVIVTVLAGVRRLRSELRALRERTKTLQGAAPLPADLTRMAQEGSVAICINILNPMELAAQKHWAGGALGRLTPGILRAIVCREAAKIVSLELPKYGAVGEVKVIGGG